MANELTVTIGMTAEKGRQKYNGGTNQSQYDVSADPLIVYSDTQNIGTTYEAVNTGSISTPGWAKFKNMSASGGNFVEIGVEVAAAFYPLVKLLAAEECAFPLTDTSFHARADTAAVDMQVTILER